MKPVTVVTVVEKRPAPTPQPRPPLWMQLEDRAVFGYIRSCAPCPAVFVMKDDQHVEIDEQWQYALVGANSRMTLENIMLLMDYSLAFCNRTGVTNPNDPRADFITGQHTTRKPPQQDKVRTTSRSVLTGVQAYSLGVALRETIAALGQTLARRQSFAALRKSFRQLLTVQNVLRVTTFDSRQPPPLKPGRTYPAGVQDVNPDDYLYSPHTHPWMFPTANIVNRSGEVVQFPRGAVYPWTGDNTPRSFWFHISHPDYGPVDYPLSRLRKLAADEPIPSPYRSN